MTTNYVGSYFFCLKFDKFKKIMKKVLTQYFKFVIFYLHTRKI